MVSFCYGDIMSKEFNKLMNAHEVDDKDYVNSVEQVKARIKDEFENYDEFLSYLESDEKAAEAFFDYSGSKPYLFSVIPVRKSDRLYVKKHTATQRPYYHSHAFYEIIFVQNGKCGFFHYPSGESYAIDRGSACLVAPGAVHALARAGKRDVILKAVVPKEIFDGILLEDEKTSEGEIAVFENVGDRAQSYFQNFVAENGKDTPLSRISERGWLALFLAELFREKEEKGGDIIEKLDIYLDNNLKNARLSDFAAYVGYAPDYVSRVIKRVTGTSFKEAVETEKLAYAKVLLCTTDMPVERVAAECGYANASGLYKQFTATYGITPARYRKARKKS